MITTVECVTYDGRERGCTVCVETVKLIDQGIKSGSILSYMPEMV